MNWMGAEVGGLLLDQTGRFEIMPGAPQFQEYASLPSGAYMYSSVSINTFESKHTLSDGTTIETNFFLEKSCDIGYRLVPPLDTSYASIAQYRPFSFTMLITPDYSGSGPVGDVSVSEVRAGDGFWNIGLSYGWGSEEEPDNNSIFSVDSYSYAYLDSYTGAQSASYHDSVFYTFTLTEPAPVPEPTTLLLLASGLIGLVGYGRKKFFKK